MLIGFAIGASLGLLVGALIGLSRAWDILLAPTLGAIRAVPSLAWVPLLILWLKIGEESKITLIAIGAFFPVYTTVSAALRHVDRHLVEAGRAFGLQRRAAVHDRAAAGRAAVGHLRPAPRARPVVAVPGRRRADRLVDGPRLPADRLQNNGRVDRIFLAIILLAILGKLTDALVGLFEKWAVRKWA